MSVLADATGRVLGGRYRLTLPLGSGASAQVFLAQDVLLDRPVAVKVLHPALARDEAFLQRFRAEARASASLHHPHLLGVLDWGEDAHGAYLVLEYLPGGSLRDLLDRGSRLSPSQAVGLGRDAAEGLAYAHARGLVHRDVKPANLLFDEEGRVMIADFGVARALAAATWTEPAGAMVGTVRYAAPEQARGTAVDGRTDVYALALVLYETVVGEVPFGGDSTVSTLMNRIGAHLPPDRSLGPLFDVLDRAADPDPGQRPDARTLVSTLASLATELPGPERLPVAIRPVSPAPAAGGALPSNGAGGDLTGLGGSPTGALVPLAGAVLAPAARAGAAPVATAAVGPRTPAPRHPTAHLTAGPVPPAPPPPPVARRRSRWPWVITVLALAALLAVGAVWAVRAKVFTPSHPVPDLTHHTVEQAREMLLADRFTLRMAPAQYSTTMPVGGILAQRPGPGTVEKEGATITVAVSKGVPPVAVPSLAGLDCSAAERVLAVADLIGTCPPSLHVYSGSVPTGDVVTWAWRGRSLPEQAPWHSTIAISISKGPKPVAVPTIGLQTYQEARDTLSTAGLKPTELLSFSATVPPGIVIRTDPAVGEMVLPGTPITVYVSKGVRPVTLPSSLLGETLSQARVTLEALGLRLGKVTGSKSATSVVTASTPSTGQSIPSGTTVDLVTRAKVAKVPSSTLPGSSTLPRSSPSSGLGAAGSTTTTTTSASSAGFP